MTPTSTNIAPISDATTEGVRVEVLSRHAPEHSKPSQNEWVFEYTVRITNLGNSPVQLVSRHWIISNALDQVKEVNGPGVVGQQPLLASGESFKYSSWCKLDTPLGTMRGTYQMLSGSRPPFDVEIAPFGLRVRLPVH
jgi:ApaG protein